MPSCYVQNITKRRIKIIFIDLDRELIQKLSPRYTELCLCMFALSCHRIIME